MGRNRLSRGKCTAVPGHKTGSLALLFYCFTDWAGRPPLLHFPRLNLDSSQLFKYFPGLTSLSTVSHVAMASACDRELSAHFQSAASLNKCPDTWRDIPPSHNILTSARPVPLSWCWVNEREAETILKSLVWLVRRTNLRTYGRRADPLATEPLQL